ncbi:MAG: hypothetical protein ABWY52_07680 [Candidatus Limnocylindrales bacterium]
MLSPLTAALLAALVVVGCDSAPDLSGRPTEADEPVIRISRFKTGDGAAERLATLPVGTLYGDGRVIRPGPQIAVEPAPALPSLQVTTLDSAGVDAVLAKAAAAGLVGADRELRMPTEADPTITAFDIFLDGQRRRTIVESLAEIADDDPRFPPKSREQRAAMKAVEAMLTDPASSLAGNIVGEDAVYAPTAVGVLVASAAEDPSTGEPTIVEWPLADLATLGSEVEGVQGLRCAVVEGEDWTTLQPLAGSANQATQWSSGGAMYTLKFRPLLPGEEGC